jgi:hypothetical protein
VNSSIIRTLLVYGIVLPLAVMVGWMLSSPLEMKSAAVVGGVMFVLLLPLVLAHHYALLLFSWNVLIVAFFVPGQPMFWTVMVAVNLAMAVAYRILQRRPTFISAPSLTLTLLAFTAVVLFTAKVNGGLGARMLGSGTYGAKGYFYLLASLAGYFAIASQPIPYERINRYLGYFTLSATLSVVSNLLFFFPALWFLYTIFPSSLAMSQAQVQFSGGLFTRLSGFSIAAVAVVQFLLIRYGVSGLIRDWRKIALFGALVFVSMWGGFRSSLLLIFALVAVLYLLEGLFWTRWTVLAVVLAGCGFTGLFVGAKKLPLNIQRAVSILPVEVNPAAVADARASSEWRVRMWRSVLPDLPKYFWVGKGFAMNPTEMALTQESVRRGLAPDYQNSLVAGDYHNGPLSLYIPFGVPGVVTFVAFLIAALRALWRNYKYGDPRLLTINRFLLAAFVVRLIMFLVVFGSMRSDVATFTGLVGLSVALNRGICPATARVKGTRSVASGAVGLRPGMA